MLKWWFFNLLLAYKISSIVSCLIVNNYFQKEDLKSNFQRDQKHVFAICSWLRLLFGAFQENKWIFFVNPPPNPPVVTTILTSPRGSELFVDWLTLTRAWPEPLRCLSFRVSITVGGGGINRKNSGTKISLSMGDFS